MGANEINGAGMPQDTIKAGKKLSDADKEKLEKAKTNGEIQKELKPKSAGSESTIQEKFSKKVDDMSYEELKKLDANLKKDKTGDSSKDSGFITYPQQIKDLEKQKAELQKELKAKGNEMSSEDYIAKELEIDSIDRQIISLKLKQKAELEQYGSPQ